MSTIQFTGSNNVVAAYEGRQGGPWAIFQGRQLLDRGEDADELKNILGMLQADGSAAVYTLKLYSDAYGVDDLTEKTPVLRSFNFQLTERQNNQIAGFIPGGAGPVNVVDSIAAKIRGTIEEEVATVVEERFADRPSGNKSLGEILAGYLEDPERLTPLIPVIQVIGSIFRGTPPAAALAEIAAPAPAAIGAVSKPGAPFLNEQNAPRIAAAVERIAAVDPDVVAALEKLADLAEKNPSQYFMAKKLL